MKIVRRNGMVQWRAWRSSLILAVLSPVMFLSAMGLGLGSLVEEERAFGGVSYLAFFATGMLAATCMQSGAFSGTYSIMTKIVWQKNYEAQLASPLSVRDVLLGEVSWAAVVLTQQAVPFFLIMILVGAVESPLGILAIPVAVLLGASCAAVMMSITATLETDEAYTWIYRFVLMPLFLLSGTFFPIDELPTWGQVVAHLTPLFHGVELVRQVTVYEVEPSAIWHLGYLLALLGLGIVLGIRNFERRLRP